MNYIIRNGIEAPKLASIMSLSKTLKPDSNRLEHADNKYVLCEF